MWAALIGQASVYCFKAARVMQSELTPKHQSTSLQKHLETEQREGSKRYDALTKRIEAIDKDLGRELDSERQLTLNERRSELVAERDTIIASIQQIESQLSELAEPKSADAEQGVQQLPDQQKITSLPNAITQVEYSLELAPSIDTGLPGPDRATSASDASMSLQGSHVIRIETSQLFRIVDILTRPKTQKARDLQAAFTEPNALRRMFNKSKGYQIGQLGKLKPVITGPGSPDPFWAPAWQDPRRPGVQLLRFIPLHMSLTEHLRRHEFDPSSLLNTVLEGKMKSIVNSQISGRIRIYPPGTGVIHMGLTLTFGEEVHAGLAAEIARNIEQLAFVDTDQGSTQVYEALFIEIVKQVIQSLGMDKDWSAEERRWRPPETTFCIADDSGFAPHEAVSKLATLMAGAPKNEEDTQFLAGQIERALGSVHWQRNHILFAAGQSVALLFVAQSAGRDEQRKNLLRWLLETRELMSAAVYAREELAEEVNYLCKNNLLDDSYLPERGENFSSLAGLVPVLAEVMRAINGIQDHLKRQGTGALTDFARDLWRYTRPGSDEILGSSLPYLADWLARVQSTNSSPELSRLQDQVNQLMQIHPPF